MDIIKGGQFEEISESQFTKRFNEIMGKHKFRFK